QTGTYLRQVRPRLPAKRTNQECPHFPHRYTSRPVKKTLENAFKPCRNAAGYAAPHLSGADLRAAKILGGPGLRHSPAIRHGNGRRHLSHGHLPARHWSRAMVGRVCAAFAPPHRWPLWRQPVPPAALLPVPGGDQTVAARDPRPVPRLPARARFRHAGARRALRRGQLGVANARRLGPRLGSVAQRHGSHAVHLLPAGWWARLPPGHGRDHLRTRTPRHVPARRRKHFRHHLGGRPARSRHVSRRVSPERSRAVQVQLRNRRHRGAAAAIQRTRSRVHATHRSETCTARLRTGHEGFAHIQSARCPPRDLGDRTSTLHPARAHHGARGGAGLLRQPRSTRLPDGAEVPLDERQGCCMSARDFLVEIGTEELPPLALPELERAFADGLRAGLKEAALSHGEVRTFATPRRLAVLVRDLASAQSAQSIRLKGPPVNAAYGKDGAPTPAALKFAEKCGVGVDALKRVTEGKGEFLFFEGTKPGLATPALLPPIVQRSLDALPIPKRMRWGASDAEFVRPVHWLVMLFGGEVVPARILDTEAGRHTRGHRFMGKRTPLPLATPADYSKTLFDDFVMADFAARRERIRERVAEAGEN